MKKVLHTLIISILLISCSNNEDCQNQFTNDNLCGGHNLGIDQLSRFSGISYIPINGVNVINETSSYRWNWRFYNDTIEVAGGRIAFNSPVVERHFFFKKNENCIDYLSSRDVYFDVNGVILDPVTNEVIQSGYSWSNYNNLQFKLQKYKKDIILIGEVSVDGVSGTKFWMEFTPDVHRTIPYEYEQYYHN